MRDGARLRWTPTRVLAGAFVVMWLAVQVGVPFVQHLTTSGARPFAWQMSSRRVEVPRFEVVAPDGSELYAVCPGEPALTALRRRWPTTALARS